MIVDAVLKHLGFMKFLLSEVHVLFTSFPPHMVPTMRMRFVAQPSCPFRAHIYLVQQALAIRLDREIETQLMKH
jgi:hypothetical protein